MKLKVFVLVALAALPGLRPHLHAQFQNPNIENFGPPTEKYLAAPDPSEGTQYVPVGTDLWEGEDNNTIHYGLTPPNSSSRPVLVFVHGYASNASVFYTGKDNMYKDVYMDGYRAAFVSLTPNRHIWTNGAMLATIIDRVCLHYGVNDVVVVGWSKGGVDTDAAIVHFGANGKVSRAFTLSTPHHGTYIAELANSWLLSLVNIIFMQDNDATRSLTRGYMSYFRSITDGHPANTVGYTTLGGWGNGPLNRLDVPQGILHLNGGEKASGGNDGVVPYLSSKRPGGNELFGGQYKAYGWWGIPYYPGPSQTELDHFEVTRGGLVWPYIKGVLNGTLRNAVTPTPRNFEPNSMVTSNMQLVTSAGSDPTFVVEEGVEEVIMQMISPNSGWHVVDGQGRRAEIRWRDGQTAQLASPDAGNYRIVCPEEFAALVTVQDGAEIRLTSARSLVAADAPMQFEVVMDGWKKELPSDLQLSGVLLRTQRLDLENVEDAPMALQFRRDGARFLAEAPATLPAGVYSLTVSARSRSIARTLVTSVAKLGTSPRDGSTSAPAPAISRLWPNPFTDRLNIEVEIEAGGNGELSIYDMLGWPVRSFPVQGGHRTIQWEARAEGAASGVYIVELSDGKGLVSRKVVLD